SMRAIARPIPDEPPVMRAEGTSGDYGTFPRRSSHMCGELTERRVSHGLLLSPDDATPASPRRASRFSARPWPAPPPGRRSRPPAPPRLAQAALVGGPCSSTVPPPDAT